MATLVSHAEDLGSEKVIQRAMVQNARWNIFTKHHLAHVRFFNDTEDTIVEDEIVDDADFEGDIDLVEEGEEGEEEEEEEEEDGEEEGEEEEVGSSVVVGVPGVGEESETIN